MTGWNTRLLAAAALAAVTAVTSGCPNNTGTSGTFASGTALSSNTRLAGTGPSGAPRGAAVSFSMVNATVTGASGGAGAAGGGGQGGPVFTLIFNAVNLANTLNDFCQVQSNQGNFDPAKSCLCRFEWNQTNQSDASVITRTVDTVPTSITSFQVECPAPDVFEDDTEIPNDTIIKIKFVPDTAKGNVSGFTTNTLNFTKRPVTATGDFRDSEGRSFRNIFHYVCYDQFQKSLGLQHASRTATTNSITQQPVLAPVANDFTTTNAGAAQSFSAQSYYFDFYVRSNEAGSINASHTENGTGFTCPQVNVNGTPSFFPMDSQFALALQASKDFPVPITSRTFVAVAGQTPGEVLGFATKPNADGTCPSFTDSTGKIRRTFRLREFTAIYPIRFNFDGDFLDQSQPTNKLFVVDRPLDKLGQDPLKPITRLGPKPCPFSFKTAQFGQKCSTDATLAGWNIDGTQINGDPKCPVYTPPPEKYVKEDGTLVIRPFKPFLSHFLENTSFKACAFQSSTPIDPEFVLSHDKNIYPAATGPHDFYCAKHYPPAGAIIPPSNGDPFDKAPGDCDLSASAAAIKTDQTYACSRTFDASNPKLKTPAAGCCQICSGPNCTSAGGGTSAAGRNAVFSPPLDAGNPSTAFKQLPRAIPNKAGGGGCFDSFED